MRKLRLRRYSKSRKPKERRNPSTWLAGVGIAWLRQAIVDGLRDSVLAFSKKVPGTTAKDIMDMVLVTQKSSTSTPWRFGPPPSPLQCSSPMVLELSRM